MLSPRQEKLKPDRAYSACAVRSGRYLTKLSGTVSEVFYSLIQKKTRFSCTKEVLWVAPPACQEVTVLRLLESTQLFGLTPYRAKSDAWTFITHGLSVLGSVWPGTGRHQEGHNQMKINHKPPPAGIFLYNTGQFSQKGLKAAVMAGKPLTTTHLVLITT